MPKYKYTKEQLNTMRGDHYSNLLERDRRISSRMSAQDRRASISRGFGVFRAVLLILLFIVLVRTLLGLSTNQFSFSSLLTVFSRAPTIDLSWISSISSNFAETFPFGLQWLGSVVDWFVSIIAGWFFVTNAIANAVIFVVYFLRVLFL